MQTTICLLGRQPAIGRAELEAIFGSEAIRYISDDIVELKVEPGHVNIDRLGGVIKTTKLLTYLETTQWPALMDYIRKTLPDHLVYIPEGKIRLGISAYGITVKPNDINKSGLGLKKIITKTGRSARVVPNKTNDLNSAQVLHNQLTGPTGLELVFIRDGKRTILAQTTGVQDITAYTKRDQARPHRDAAVGMLPPKLAQVIINLATGDKTSGTVLDPFCGTGVLLQEALLAGFSVVGSDVEARMVDYSQRNLVWLRERHTEVARSLVERGDATNHAWKDPFDFIAAETYLGKPFDHLATQTELSTILPQVDNLHRKTLENIASQTPEGFRLCLAVPAWRKKSGFIHLPCLDDLEKLGYTRLKFVHASNQDLIYCREDQFVGRELVVLIRK